MKHLFSEKKSKKNKKKAVATENSSEGLFQIVDQADLSETDIEVRDVYLRKLHFYRSGPFYNQYCSSNNQYIHVCR